MKTWRLLLKSILLFAALNFLFIAIAPGFGFTPSIYNVLVLGRERLPFGENPAAYNLSLFDIDAMFAAHEIAAPKADDEIRVVVIGDSSVWGTLLRNEETLTGQLDVAEDVRVYNLGYPTISLTKDLLILQKTLEYQPDLIVWMITLESFPQDKQLTVPLVSNNATHVDELVTVYGLDADPNSDALTRPDFWDTTLIGRRRALADWYRLQVYGVMWGITGIDQLYPESYTAAQLDFDTDATFHGMNKDEFSVESLAFNALETGFALAGETPMVLVNEPILISDGENSDIRYNFFYPRWAYDQYRDLMQTKTAENQWRYYDFWDLVPMDEFTNSGVHLTPTGEALLADQVAELILEEIAR
jgi:hypothetical protein